MKDEDVVRSATRVLSVLEALNARVPADLVQLQAATALPKPTIVRLLHTLVQAGYVWRISRTEGYTLTERVLRLSDGFQHTEAVVAVARGHLDAFTAAYKWPMGLQIYERGAMVPRYFTGSRSPLNADGTLRAQRFPMLTTAHGQAYLAFCSDQERDLILAMLRASKSRGNALAQDEDFVASTLPEVRRQGYALRAATPSDRVLGFAVPVLQGDGVAATVGMRYFGTAMRPDAAVARYLLPLQTLASAIASALVHDVSAQRSAGPTVQAEALRRRTHVGLRGQKHG